MCFGIGRGGGAYRVITTNFTFGPTGCRLFDDLAGIAQSV